MENTNNQSSLQWHLTRLPTELCLLILEYVVIGSHENLAKSQMQKEHLFILALNQFHRIFLSLHNSFGCHITNDFFSARSKNLIRCWR